MADEKVKKFNSTKEKVVENLEFLLSRVEDCEEYGMLDTDAELYNHVLSIKEEAETSESYQELAEAIAIGKEIEQNIDAFFINKGLNTITLSWPDISKLME